MLNEKQKLAYETILNSDKRIILIKGEAGTGKSFLLNQVATDFNGSMLITATTHKAKEVLASITNQKTFTTHSALGFVMIRYGTEEYLSKQNEAKSADMLIIDEISMLPASVYQAAISEPFKKIVLIGDSSQLKAIGISADIKADVEIELTEQMRQNSDIELKEYLNTLRAKTTQNLLFLPHINTPKNIILYKDHKEFCKAYLDSDNNKRILAYSNRCVDSYNTNINQSRFKAGDLIILDKPVMEFRNSDIVRIDDITEMKDFYKLKISKEHLSYEVIAFKTKSKEKEYLDDILKNNNALYWAKRDEIIHPKLIFASTIHKAQGDTIDEVFIDITDIYNEVKKRPSRFNNYNPPMSINEFNRLVYVAISRMRYKAHLYIGQDKRNYKTLKGSK